MKKILLFFLILFNLSIQLQAQKVKYTTHTLAQGETLSTLAEKYNTTVGDIMRLNDMYAGAQLAEGQKIRIPPPGVTVQRSSQGKPQKSSAIPPPVNHSPVSSSASTHIVQDGETLYSISKNYGVTVEQLKEWNKLPDNSISNGQELAVNAAGASVVGAHKTEAGKLPAQNTSGAVEKKDAEATVQPPAAGSEAGDVLPVKQGEQATTNSASASSATDGSDDYFLKDYKASAEEGNSKNVNGEAMVFKTASGWQDRKYYILTNEAPTGAIVKVSSSNGNTIYAKVLWKLEDMKANQGLSFRISDAAASTLGVTSEVFRLTLQYHD